jgi:outer membrane protein TolC
MDRISSGLSCALASVLLGAFGCATPHRGTPVLPSVAPATQPSASLDMKSEAIGPMYRELLAVDLSAVVRVAMARNLDILQARQRVEASKGRYESSVEAIFPVIAPSVAYQHLEGVNPNANGTLALTNFNDFLPAISVQWILNPGRVVYDIIASKRRMEASEHQERSVTLETARTAALRYYDLVAAQAQLGVARQGVAEAAELLRITHLKVKTGTGLPTDELRAEANLAGLQQDVVVALNQFYQSSVALTLTLHLDPVVTLVPNPGPIRQTTLVRDDLPIDNLLAMAVQYRPDLEAVRSLLRAAKSDSGATVWGGLGPQLQAGYTFGGLQGRAAGRSFGMHEQQKAGIGASFAFGLSTFGQVKTASANEKSAEIDVRRQLDEVRAAVVSAQQASDANSKLIPIARRQLDAAESALQLTQTNLKSGTMLTIDVLEAQAASDLARLRYVNAVIHYNQSQVNLLAALGLIDEKSLNF